jgi:outer membrane biogenesis lipoprotein LolB
MKLFLVSLSIVGTLLLPGCSMLTERGRQERRYENYIKKSRVARAKQQSRIKSGIAKTDKQQASQFSSEPGPVSVSAREDEPAP